MTPRLTVSPRSVDSVQASLAGRQLAKHTGRFLGLAHGKVGPRKIQQQRHVSGISTCGLLENRDAFIAL